MNITEKRSNEIYDILVNLGGASEMMRSAFVYHHTKSGCSEWRFGGKLGFGGKYRSYYNKIDCYSEDETPERLQLIAEINTELKKIKENAN